MMGLHTLEIERGKVAKAQSLLHHSIQWIGLRENLQETIEFPIKYGGFPVNSPLNQSIDP